VDSGELLHEVLEGYRSRSPDLLPGDNLDVGRDLRNGKWDSRQAGGGCDENLRKSDDLWLHCRLLSKGLSGSEKEKASEHTKLPTPIP